MDSQNNKRKKEFSKTLLIQESFLIWIITLSFIFMAFISIWNGYLGSLPWLTAMVTCPWAAYGVSQGFYYKKSEKENTKGGIKYDAVMAEIQAKYQQTINSVDWNVADSSLEDSRGLDKPTGSTATANSSTNIYYGI